MDSGADDVDAATHTMKATLRRLGLFALMSVGVVLLLLRASTSTSAFTVIRGASIWWLAACVVATAGTYLAAAVSTIGSTTTHLPVRRTVGVQVAASFANRFVPGGIAGNVLNVRLIERAGADRASAISSTALNNAAGLVMHVALLVAIAPFFGALPHNVEAPDDEWLLVVVLVALLVGGAAFWFRHLPRRWGDHLRTMWAEARAVMRSPRLLLALLGGSAAITMCHALALWAAQHSVSGSARIVDVVIVYLVASAIGAASPTPGGLGAIEIALVTGLTRVGTPASEAAASVILYRFISFWLPIAPGYLSYRAIRRTGGI